jgi:CMP-N-acetylneuraminic acid synthetase
MYQDKKTLCIIAARGGSKRLPGKNILPLLGKPLMQYAIEAARGSKRLDKTVVSTDSEDVAAVARGSGVEVLMRPAELAADDSPVIPALQHAVRALEEKGERYDFIMLIQPTNPGVLAHDVDEAIEKISTTQVNSCITVCEITDRPEWMYRMALDGTLSPFKEVSIMLSQKMEPLFRVNGAVYVVRRDVLMNDGKLIDKQSCAGVVVPKERSVDIDTALDFSLAEAALKQGNL